MFYSTDDTERETTKKKKGKEKTQTYLEQENWIGRQQFEITDIQIQGKRPDFGLRYICIVLSTYCKCSDTMIINGLTTHFSRPIALMHKNMHIAPSVNIRMYVKILQQIINYLIKNYYNLRSPYSK